MAQGSTDAPLRLLAWVLRMNSRDHCQTKWKNMANEWKHHAFSQRHILALGCSQFTSCTSECHNGDEALFLVAPRGTELTCAGQLLSI